MKLYFLCRHCYDLVYESQRDNAMYRALHKGQSIRKRLGGSANMTEPFPEKPKGMHWKTYERFWWEHHEAEMDDRMFGGAGFDGMIGYGGDDLLSGGARGDFIDAKENSENPGEDTVRGGRGRDFIDAIDETKDTINCGKGIKDEVFYDENLDTVENCEIAMTQYPEETNTLRAR